MFPKNALIKTIFVVITILSLAACASQASPATTSAPVAASSQTQAITLKLAVSDDTGNPSEPYVNEFVSQVSSLSAGAITIIPIWNAGLNTADGFEVGVIKAVIAGQFDLGLASAKAWDYANANITSFQALQTPFLINNDALAIAVATSDISKQMLDNLSASGVTGLTLWPEDLRHPFSIPPTLPLLSPADFSGLTIREYPSGVAGMLIQQLGGTPMFADSGYQGAESGLTNAALSLSGRPTGTGNVTFFAKFQVLFANGAAFKALSSAQQDILRQAAAATQKKAIAEHPNEADIAKAFCANGGTVVLASADQLAAFEKAAQPVSDSIAKDPANKKLIAAIQDLKTKTTASTGAAACQSSVAQAISTPTLANQVWSPGLPPNGVWQVNYSTDELVALGFLKYDAQSWTGTFTLTLQDGKMSEVYNDGGSCSSTYAVAGNVVRLTYPTTGDQCTNEVDDLQWRVDNQGLHLNLVAIQNANFHDAAAIWGGKPWQKVK